MDRGTVGRTVEELVNRGCRFVLILRLGRRGSVVGRRGNIMRRRGNIVRRRGSMVSVSRLVNTCCSSPTRHVNLAVLRVPARHVHALLQGGCRQRQQHH